MTGITIPEAEVRPIRGGRYAGPETPDYGPGFQGWVRRNAPKINNLGTFGTVTGLGLAAAGAYGAAHAIPGSDQAISAGLGVAGGGLGLKLVDRVLERSVGASRLDQAAAHADRLNRTGGRHLSEKVGYVFGKVAEYGGYALGVAGLLSSLTGIPTQYASIGLGIGVAGNLTANVSRMRDAVYDDMFKRMATQDPKAKKPVVKTSKFLRFIPGVGEEVGSEKFMAWSSLLRNPAEAIWWATHASQRSAAEKGTIKTTGTTHEALWRMGFFNNAMRWLSRTSVIAPSLLQAGVGIAKIAFPAILPGIGTGIALSLATAGLANYFIRQKPMYDTMRHYDYLAYQGILYGNGVKTLQQEAIARQKAAAIEAERQRTIEEARRRAVAAAAARPAVAGAAGGAGP